MKCPKCQLDNTSDSKFCKECGTQLHLGGDILFSKTMTLETPFKVLDKGSTFAGKYKIIGEIGRGGMGVVLKAEDMKLRRMVALKFLPPELSSYPEAKERFIREAQAAAALDHPHICTIYEAEESEGQAYIAMAYVDGLSLKERIAKSPLTIEEAIDIGIQVAEGLEEAHKKGIVHRDIKSANIMVTEKGQAKVMDFGLAKVMGESLITREGRTMGTVAYMSPEQAKGEVADLRSDIWSLGVVMYEMLSGQLPFGGEGEASILYSIVHAEPKPLKDIKRDLPPDVQKVLDRALKKNPGSRYQTAADMSEDLRKYREMSRAAEAGVFNVRSLLRRIRQPKIAIPAVLLIIAIVFLGGRLFKHQARVRWARGVVLPEVEKLIEENDVWRNLTEAYRLAEKAEEYIPHDAKLSELFSKCSLNVNITTEPPGAKVSMKEYMAPESDWTYLGVTPIENIRLPIGIFRWKMEKEGYETVLAAASTWSVEIGKHNVIIPGDLMRVLDKKGGIPPDMVRVQGAETAVGKLDDFYIDKYEVTNNQYKGFIDKGGYKTREFWKQKFIKDGRELAWDEATRTFVDQTGQPGPSTWQAGDYPEGQADYPVSGISWYEAAAYAEFAGKSLPTGYHWGIARGEYTTLIQVPQLGGFALFAPFSNFKGKGPVPVGSLSGLTSFGAFDMAGNVREWCWNDTPKGKLIRGGAWGDNTYMFDNLSQAPAMDRSVKNGFRCALYPDPGKIPIPVLQAVKLGETIDFYKEKPAPDSVFQVYKDQFSYDKTDLKARVESRKESPGGWIQEKVSFDAAYGGERIIAYLFLPKNTSPPYQTVIYFPGSASEWQRSSQDIESYYEYPMFLSFIVKNGRAVLYPVYKGTFERGNDSLAAVIDYNMNSHQFTEIFIQEIKDFKRCVDYLETRSDIDSKKIAYYGMSWGAMWGAIIPAVEERLKTSVLLAGGFSGNARPEVNQINYVTRVKIPTLMLNGKYDTILPVETSQKPMFDLLGTPAEHKQCKLYDTDHIPPVNEFIKETLAWLDKYLGPVNR
jgi:formylglycine-generating enzyme required for sulfatase activity/dienelactone hydrolase